MFLIVSFSGRPVYDPNPLRPNPNPKKPVSGSCRVRELGRTLTPLVKLEVHYGGAFVWNLSLVYFGGKVEIVYSNADLLGYFEIKGICEELGIDESC